MRLVNLQNPYALLFTPGTQVDLVGQVADPIGSSQSGLLLNKGENLTVCIDNRTGGAMAIPFNLLLQLVPGGLWSTLSANLAPALAEFTYTWTVRGYAVRLQTPVLGAGAPWYATVSAAVYATD